MSQSETNLTGYCAVVREHLKLLSHPKLRLRLSYNVFTSKLGEGAI